MLVDNTPSRLVNLVGASLCVHPLGPYIFLPWKDISLFTGGVSTPTSTHTLCRSCVPFLHVSVIGYWYLAAVFDHCILVRQITEKYMEPPSFEVPSTSGASYADSLKSTG